MSMRVCECSNYSKNMILHKIGVWKSKHVSASMWVWVCDCAHVQSYYSHHKHHIQLIIHKPITDWVKAIQLLVDTSNKSADPT